ncbi:PAS domain-containing protein [Methylobacterium bullatum]|uniref:histidine kinase n=1 Tax=Methylobacterium bullatum TaxID=570505 RepID=A0A679JLX8_9HYPH|nr:putative diguanylate cyclase YegE [Methylobacterium bullatum]
MPARSLMRPSWAATTDKAKGGFSSRHFLRLVESSIDIGFWSGDLDGELIEGSIGLYRVFGLDPSIALTFGFAKEMMHPEDRARHADLLPLLRTGQPMQREFRIIRPDQTQRWVLHRVEVLIGPDGRPKLAIGMVKDVTPRYEVEMSVEQGNDRFKALIEATAAVVWTVSPDGRVQDMPQWRMLTGQSQAEVQGDGWLEAIHPDDRDLTASAWQFSVSHREPYNTDYRLQLADGSYRWYNARGVPILNRDGSVREWIGICLDISDRHRVSSSSAKAAGATAAQDITVEQIRGARGMTGLSAEELGRRAGVSVSTVRRLESEATTTQARPDTILAVRQVLEAAGIEFTFEANAKPGVRPA